ncbi:hypothetical protein DIQ79_15795 [Mycolicibacterium smegmatis]|uniref:Uncharacterized protein n=1 Tax=Mycolicibacterium smegmatis (strain ATCC 700084 / mc(2)155) TaxID=246196 RepID=A0QX59_MYCS2|nr:hypothetical protein MSMEG_3182 [Mycolicibacterium smegmatis MC2 155]TBM41987.1 hypothetical protein DIQ86_21885 [Mycolicibacterium smegmatis]TBH44949.1 hypothetical protein EYS45_15380 [Mycolicibacterium smegmatis MC2 155]TBM50223.1 hypothetical protein DIQ85_16765 [Mycolicibacterium smegmatis]TBM61223.1 hypothetical protein DIQ83_16825 [Mycolicibacterium smegmatis]
MREDVPSASQVTVAAAAAESTAVLAVIVTAATTRRTTAPTASAISLYAGHGTPATLISRSVRDPARRKFPAAVIATTIARKIDFGYPKHRMWASGSTGTSCRYLCP